MWPWAGQKKCDHEAAILSQAEDDIEDVDDVDVVVDFRVVKVVNEVRHGVEGDEGAGPADAGWAVNHNRRWPENWKSKFLHYVGCLCGLPTIGQCACLLLWQSDFEYL